MYSSKERNCGAKASKRVSVLEKVRRISNSFIGSGELFKENLEQ